MATELTETAVRDRLAEIVDPCAAARGTNHDVVSMGLLKTIEIEEDAVTVRMRLTSPACFMVPYFIRETEQRVGSIDGVESVTLETDAGLDWMPEMMSEEARDRRRKYLDALDERHRAHSNVEED
jgi:metal-sulfur cluster biosynthetic enzyme